MPISPLPLENAPVVATTLPELVVVIVPVVSAAIVTALLAPVPVSREPITMPAPLLIVPDRVIKFAVKADWVVMVPLELTVKTLLVSGDDSETAPVFVMNTLPVVFTVSELVLVRILLPPEPMLLPLLLVSEMEGAVTS